MWVGVGAGVGVDFSKPESESESESLKFGRLRSPGTHRGPVFLADPDGQRGPDCPDRFFCRFPHTFRDFCEGFGPSSRGGPKPPRGSTPSPPTGYVPVLLATSLQVGYVS